MINPQQAVKWYRDKYGETPLSDYEIYEKLKDKFKDSDFGENPYDRKEKPSLEYEEQDPSMWEKILTYNIVSNCSCASRRIAGTGLFAILLGRCGFGLIRRDALSLNATSSSGLVIWHVRAWNNSFGSAHAG